MLSDELNNNKLDELDELEELEELDELDESEEEDECDESITEESNNDNDIIDVFNNKEIHLDTDNDNIEFQIIDIQGGDGYYDNSVKDQNEPDEDEDNKKRIEYKYILKVFGKTKKGNSVYLQLLNYKPYFYIEFGKSFRLRDSYKIDDKLVDKFFNKLHNNIEFKHRSSFIKYKKVKSYKLYGFTNKKKFRFYKIILQTKSAWYTYAKEIRNLNYDVYNNNITLYESNLDPMLRFIHLRDLNSAGWVKVNSSDYWQTKEKKSRCQIDITANWKQIHKIEKSIIAPFCVLSFDLECSSIDGSFPQVRRTRDNINDIIESGIHVPANYKGDSIISIGCTYSIVGRPNIVHKHVLCLNVCADIEGVTVKYFGRESDLIIAFSNLVKDTDPDYLIGYNIYGFDYKYLYGRAEVLGIDQIFNDMSRLQNKHCKLIKKELSSAALGVNEMSYMDLVGRINLDLLKVVQRDYKFKVYKLDFVANYFLGVGKDDVTPQEIFKLQNGTPLDRKRLNKYCIQDCELCNKLESKLDIIINTIAMANIASVPVNFILLRGQGIKVFSSTARFCHKYNYRIKVVNKSQVYPKQNKGAFVLTPQLSFYDLPVAVCDFKSLYPCCMISENLSHDTWVNDPEYDNIEGIEYLDIDSEFTDGTILKIRFKQPEKQKDGTILNEDRGILCMLEIKLLDDRSKYKKLMESETDPFKKKLYNSMQLAIKVMCNSIYGQTGASTSQICCKFIAAATTAMGRHYLMSSKEIVEKDYGAEVVYGDSVTGDTPIIINNNGKIYPTRIDTIVENTIVENTIVENIENENTENENTENENTENEDKWIKYYGDKQQFKPKNMMVYEKDKFVKILRIIRHKVNKKLYRTTTNHSIIDCTEDHSLLNNNDEKIKPTECIIGKTKLLMCTKYPKANSSIKMKPEYIKEIVKTFKKSFVQTFKKSL
jgi:DNA polymerase delta subunit 1